jgi:hypothetical protein
MRVWLKLIYHFRHRGELYSQRDSSLRYPNHHHCHFHLLALYSYLVEVVWSAFYFCLSFSVCFSFFMLFSYFANPVNYCWFSSSFSINVVRLSVVKLLASLIVVTLGCHSLLKNLKIFLVATSLATGLPSPCKRFCQESESFFTFRRWFHHRPCEIIQTLELKHWS